MNFKTRKTMSATLVSLDFNVGNTNGSGIADVFVCPKNFIKGWPTIDDDLPEATDLTSYTEYTGNFTMAEGKTFIRAYNVQGEGQGDAEGIGDRDSKMFNNKVAFRFPKMTKENLALQKAIMNGDVVVVFWHDNKYRVVGHKHYRSDTNVKTTTGAAAGSSKGTTYEIECPDFAPLPAYNGTLQLPDGVLNCATDEFTPS